jgi:hypothetical protein
MKYSITHSCDTFKLSDYNRTPLAEINMFSEYLISGKKGENWDYAHIEYSQSTQIDGYKNINRYQT